MPPLPIDILVPRRDLFSEGLDKESGYAALNILKNEYFLCIENSTARLEAFGILRSEGSYLKSNVSPCFDKSSNFKMSISSFVGLSISTS